MSVTIKDVAKKAGVATSTVSRVLSDSPNISEKTKTMVRKVMEDLGYHLNENARSLVQRSTKTIGIVMKNSTSQSLHDPFFPEVLRGISAYCNKLDFSISLTTGESEEAIFQDVIKMVQGKKVDGIIVSYSKDGDKVVPYLIECKIPFVVVGKPVDQESQVLHVDNDNVQASRKATDFLIKLGHKHIAFIGGNTEFEVSRSRMAGYSEAILLNHLQLKESYIKNPSAAELAGQSVEELMSLELPPTGLVVADDLTALCVLLKLKELQVDVPKQMSVISFNNTMIARFAIPPLTSVDTQIYQLGYESARCLMDEIKDPTTIKRSVIIPTYIKERNSCSMYSVIEK